MGKFKTFITESATTWDADSVVDGIMEALNGDKTIRTPYTLWHERHWLNFPVNNATDIEDNAAHIESPGYKHKGEADKLKADTAHVAGIFDKMFKKSEGRWWVAKHQSSGEFRIYINDGSKLDGIHNGITALVEYHPAKLSGKQEWERERD